MKIISFIFLASFLFANTKIFATNVKEVNNTYIITNPLIFYDGYVVQAKKAILKDKKLYVKDKVFVYKNEYFLSANSLNFYNKFDAQIKNLFFYSRDFDGWIRAKEAKEKGNIIKFKRLYFSTCCIDNPDWFIKSHRATYDRENKDIKFYNITLYLKNVPILYLPYLYVSFNKQRRSGLLRPYIGFSEDEGILYSQPIYFATSINTDLEITPTIRTKRGEGVYATFRFVDSPNSKGMLKAGIFEDRDKFYKQNNLANKIHFGYSVFYQRNFKYSKLYMDLKYANDVDYFYLDAYNYNFDTVYLSDKIISSKLNFISIFKRDFLGIYFNHFIDTSKVSNEDTWQIYPQINYHRFLSKEKSFFSSSDINFYHYYQLKGDSFLLGSFNSYISFYYSLFNNFLNLRISELINGGYGYYTQKSETPSKYFSLNTQFSLYTSLTKKNNNFFHIISPSVILNIKNYRYEKINSDLVNFPDFQNYLSFILYQKLFINSYETEHKINGTYYIQKGNFSVIENRIKLKRGIVSIEERNKYSPVEKESIYNYVNFSLDSSNFSMSLSNVYQKGVSKSISYNFSYNFNKIKKMYLKYSYDLDYKYTKYMLIGIKLNKKCWNYDFSVKQSRVPVLEENGVTYRKNYLIGININFVPIGGVNQTFVFKGL